MIPQDPAMLLSFVNTKLRDHYPSLAELCSSLDLNQREIEDKLAQMEYMYDQKQNRFV